MDFWKAVTILELGLIILFVGTGIGNRAGFDKGYNSGSVVSLQGDIYFDNFQGGTRGEIDPSDFHTGTGFAIQISSGADKEWIKGKKDGTYELALEKSKNYSIVGFEIAPQLRNNYNQIRFSTPLNPENGLAFLSRAPTILLTN